MRLAALLRLTAIGIALMCWLDPPSSIAPPPPIVVDAAIVRSDRDEKPDGQGRTVTEAAHALLGEIDDELGRDGAVRVHDVPAGGALPCDAVKPCVVVTEGAALTVPSDRKGALDVLLTGAGLSPNIEVSALSPGPAHLDGLATALVDLDGRGVKGSRSRLRVLDGAAVVGEAVHTWSDDGDARVAVPWWPAATGRRRLTVKVTTEGIEELTLADNEASASAVVGGERWRVVVLERRPSWSGTFLRRALEADRRFEVVAESDVAPRVRVTAGENRLAGDALDRARVVVVGAPEALSSADVLALDRFVRDRGGALILAPDRPMSGAVDRLLQHRWRERLDEAVSAAGPLKGSEWLIASETTPLDTVWAAAGEGPAIVASPAGAGVVLVSGAMDAWRHRGTDGAFDRFWQGAVAGLAMAVGPPVKVHLTSDASSGETYAHIRAATVQAPQAWLATASQLCDELEPAPVRLWPTGGAGTFVARLPTAPRDQCRVRVQVDGVGEDEQPMLLAPDSWSRRWSLADANALARRTGGRVVTDGDVRSLVQGWLAARSTERRPEVRYPMRAWWWVLAFGMSLAGEWWLRRRIGRR